MNLFLLALGAAMVIGGLRLTFKTLDQVYLTHGWSVNKCVAKFFIGMALSVGGGIAVAFSLGAF